MLIYLDANIVQYCADYGDVVFHRAPIARMCDRNLEIELRALAEVIDLAVRAEERDLDHRWDVAVPSHLMDELLRGRPTPEQVDVYRSLREAWRDLGVEEYETPDVETVDAIHMRLADLNLRDAADRRHLAEAVAIGAKWFLTLDTDVLEKTRAMPTDPGMVCGVTVARPSELRTRITMDPVFGLRFMGA